MTDPSGPAAAHTGGVLARMVSAHKRKAEVSRDRTPALSRAWDRTLRRAGAAFKGLNVVPDEITVRERTSLADGLAALPETGLVAALEDRDGNRGLIGLSHGVVDALIEVQTTGKVEERGLPARPVTRIDEALSRDFLDLSLAAWTHETTDHEDRDWPERMSFGSAVPDRRQLPLLMPDQAYHLFSATVSLGEDVPRTGQAVLLLPCTGPARRPGAAQPSGTASGADKVQAPEQPAEWKLAMEASMQEAELTLDAVLLRTRRSLYEVERLQPGDLIHFGPSELASVRLETSAGRHVATGRLGQIGGMRALRLSAPVGTSPVHPAGLGGPAEGVAETAGLGSAPPGGLSALPAGGPDPGGVDLPGEGWGPLGGAPDGSFGDGGPMPAPAPLPDLPALDPPGPGDLPDPGLPDPALPGSGGGMAGPMPDLPDLPEPGSFDPAPMPAPAPLDFAPQTAPIDFDNLPE
jgi:flagellar motor switch protein FliM